MLQLEEPSIVEIYNVLGKKIKSYENIKENINLGKSDLGKGVFYVTIITENKLETKRLIIK